MEHTDAVYTYEAIAKKVGLDELTTLRYLKFMKTRWADQEEQHCKCSYATEWAKRFKRKSEFSDADTSGQQTLLAIDAEITKERCKGLKVIKTKKENKKQKGGGCNEKN